MSRTSPFFIPQKEIDMIDSMNEELIDEIVGQSVDIYKVSIIEDYILEQFDINNSYFQIYYYGNPKKLRNEFIKYGYQLKNDQGIWQIYLNE